jgi:ribose transport system ATP-binding protein
VYQRLSILEDLTVAENMVFAMPRARRPGWSHAGDWTREKLAAIGASIDPTARVTELSVADRQLLEIAKALALSPRVLVLDEPTESLTPAEAERLFERIRSICATGTAVVYISHRLPEVRQIADRITVLRDGQTRGTMPVANASEAEILRLIIGRSVDQAFPDKATAREAEAPLLKAEKLSGSRFHDVDLAVRPGEIVGLAGVEGNGQREFLRALAGLVPASGELKLQGRTVPLGHPAKTQAARITHLPGDRYTEGLFLQLSVRENVSVLALPSMARGGVLQHRTESQLVAREIHSLSVKTPSTETPVAYLSGGNQQKVLFARSLLADPMVLLADEPTRGIDAGARIEVYEVLRRTAESGKAVMVLSSDAVELQGLCDRVLVFSGGQIVRSLEGDDITEENITGAAITSATHHGGLAARALRMLRARRFAAGDYMPSLVLLALIVGLALYTSISNSLFFTQFNFTSMLLLASALAFISLGQLMVVIIGGIDLSVGPLSGLCVVVFSFFASQGNSGGRVVLGIFVVLGVAIAVGLVNAALVKVFKLAAVLATLSTYIVLQGISLALRPQPAGFIRADVISTLKTSWGWVPVAFLIACLLAIVLELLLRYSRGGLELRAVGSDETTAHRLGARVAATQVTAFVLCSLFTALGGFMLASQVGVGDPKVGVSYTLTSITAVVLGGASIFGGRGSFIGALLGAVLIQEIITSTTFLHIGVAWQSFLPGILILVGAGVYSRARQARTALSGEATAVAAATSAAP